MLELIARHFSVFRVALFFCCFGYCAIAFGCLRPRGREIPAAIMAAWVQFSVGVFLDAQIVRLGFWTYRPMEWSLYGVPLDLHLDWTLIWGFALVWLASRLRVFERSARFVLSYLALWTFATLALDAAFGRRLPFVATSSPLWWLADVVLLSVLLGLTLWVYSGILHPPSSRARHRWNCRVRSVLYVSSLGYVFYVYLPGVILALTGDAPRPLLGLHDWRVLALAALPALVLGSWAMFAFADEGEGTPLPLDPPLHLVTRGPYAYVRNPMQIAGMWLAILLLLFYPTNFIAIYVLDMAITATMMMNLFERAQLQQSFGVAYERYARSLFNWVPRFAALSRGDLKTPETNIQRNTHN